MGGACKGTCDIMFADQPATSNAFQMGFKLCRQCNKYMQWDGVFCPCCGNRIRSKAGSGTARKRRIEVARY